MKLAVEPREKGVERSSIPVTFLREIVARGTTGKPVMGGEFRMRVPFRPFAQPPRSERIEATLIDQVARFGDHFLAGQSHAGRCYR